MTHRRALALVVLALGGCDAPAPADTGPAPSDAGRDAIAVDAPAMDTGVDAPAPGDTGVDAPTTLDAAMADAGVGLGPCVCARSITAADHDVDVSALAPGSTVCLMASASPYGPLTIHGFAGTDAAPIVVRNCDGPVAITSPDGRFAMSLSGSHFRITGAGAAGTPRGLVMTAPMAAVVLAVGHADHYELDHLEVAHGSYAGIMAKVDPGTASCMQFDRRYDPFVMQGVSIHDDYVHDMATGEGLYLGDSFYTGTSTQFCGATPGCDLTPCGGMQYPHAVRGVRVFHNVFETTGREGIQVGAADDDCEISDNVVRTFGTAGIASQNYGLQVGTGSSCRVFRNLVQSGTIGMNIQGIGGTVVANNVILDVDSGMQINPRPTPLHTDIVDQTYAGGFRIVNNTVISRVATGPLLDDINPSNPLPSVGNVIEGNLFVGGGTPTLRITPRYMWTSAANLTFASVTAAGLDTDQCPAAGSSAIDAAQDETSFGVVGDYRGMPRPLGAGWDVGALECH